MNLDKRELFNFNIFYRPCCVRCCMMVTVLMLRAAHSKTHKTIVIKRYIFILHSRHCAVCTIHNIATAYKPDTPFKCIYCDANNIISKCCVWFQIICTDCCMALFVRLHIIHQITRPNSMNNKLNAYHPIIILVRINFGSVQFIDLLKLN